MQGEILNAYGHTWITVPENWDTSYFETLVIPNMGTFMKLSVFTSEILEVPYEWIHTVRFNSDTKLLDIILDKCALDTDRLTATINMCINRWRPCLVGLYSEYSDDECVYGTTYLKISINI